MLTTMVLALTYTYSISIFLHSKNGKTNKHTVEATDSIHALFRGIKPVLVRAFLFLRRGIEGVKYAGLPGGVPYILWRSFPVEQAKAYFP